MATEPAFQFDYAGMLIGPAEADESPLEEGVFLLPAFCTFTPPPLEIPEDKWPRWRNGAWELVQRPEPVEAVEPSPLAKLQAFLVANPDVAGLLTAEGALPQPAATT